MKKRLISEHKNIEEKEKILYILKERIKELSGLYGLFKIAGKQDSSLEQIFQGVIDLIPPAWQYPEAVCARIIFEDKQFKTNNFKTTEWAQSADIVVEKKKAGAIEIYYLEEKPKSYEGPFLKGERDLIDSLATQLGIIVKRKRTEKALLESETRFRSLVSNIPGVIYRCANDPNWTMEFISNTIKEISGYPPSDFLKNNVRSYASIIHPDDRKMVYQVVQEGVNQKRPYIIYYRIIHANGQVRWVYEKGQGIFDEKGNFLWLDGAIFDITEHKKVDEELLFKNILLEAQSETSIDGILVVDDEGRSILFNKRFVEMWNMPQRIVDTRNDEKMLEYALAQLKNPDSFLKKVKYLYSHKNEKSRDEIEFKDEKVFDRYSSALIDQNGKYYGRIWYFRDITERKKAEKLLKRDKETFELLVNKRTTEMLEIQKELGKSKHLSDLGTLAATVAHELRNPLGVIQMAIYNIKRKLRDKSLDKHILNIESKILESSQTINNLLNYSQIKMPKIEETKIYDILNECAKFTKESFPKQKISIVKNFKNLKNVIIQADPYQIKQVLINILNNAAQALSEKGVAIQIKGELDKNKESIKISIKDNGVGIEKTDLKRVFDPFFTRKSKGTGLGLTICKELVNLHNGQIEIESEKGHGTAVKVSLPIRINNGDKNLNNR